MGCFPTPPRPCRVTASLFPPRLTLSLYYYHRHCRGKSLIFYLFFISRLWVRTYGRRGCPRRPNPLRGKDLGQQHNNTTALEHQVKIVFVARDSHDIRHLPLVGGSDLATLAIILADLSALMALWVSGVEDNASSNSGF